MFDVLHNSSLVTGPGPTVLQSRLVCGMHVKRFFEWNLLIGNLSLAINAQGSLSERRNKLKRLVSCEPISILLKAVLITPAICCCAWELFLIQYKRKLFVFPCWVTRGSTYLYYLVNCFPSSAQCMYTWLLPFLITRFSFNFHAIVNLNLLVPLLYYPILKAATIISFDNSYFFHHFRYILCWL